MRISPKFLSLFLVFFLLWSCGDSERVAEEKVSEPTPTDIQKSAKAEVAEESEITEQKTAAKDEMTVTPVQNTESGKEKILIEQKIIKDAEARFQVKNLDKSAINIQQTLKKYDAYVSSVNQTRQYGAIESQIVIRVKSNDFEKLLEDLLKESVFLDYKNINAQDVTEEFVDTQSRLKTKKAVEQRYVEILQKAQTIDEILQVEEKLRLIREEIEAKEGRLKFLENRVDYSTITLKIFEVVEGEPVADIGFFSKLGAGFARGWHNLLEFIIDLSYGWPFILGFGLGIFFFVRWIRNLLKKSNTNQKPNV